MPPKTRSRGVPPPSRVYNETPTLQQTTFPPRRRTVTYSRVSRNSAKKQRQQRAEEDDEEEGEYEEKEGRGKARGLRQQTLTQIDFVSSFDEDDEDIVIEDSEEDGFRGADKENKNPDGLEEEEPRSSGRKRKAKVKPKSESSKSKRRRTLGDYVQKRNEKKTGGSRRKTLGDVPVPALDYHTQTLTQFLAKERSMIKDSQDDNEFEAWLGEDMKSPSLKGKKSARKSQVEEEHMSEDGPADARDQESPSKRSIASHRTSVVPQTPLKKIRFEIPSSSQASTPFLSSQRMVDRYGPANVPEESPSGKHSQSIEQAGEIKTVTPSKRRISEIKDSYASESWGSTQPGPATPGRRRSPLKILHDAGTPSVSGTPSTRKSSLASEMNTPTKRMPSRELGEDMTPRAKGQSSTKKTSPLKMTRGRMEIPDSDEEDEDEADDDVEGQSDKENQGVPDAHDDDESNEKENRTVMSEEVHTEKRKEEQHNIGSEGHDKEKSKEDERHLTEEADDNFVAGAETQFAMDQLTSTVDSLSTPSLSREPSSTHVLSRQVSSISAPSSSRQISRKGASIPPSYPKQSSQPPLKPSKRLRKPVLRRLPGSSQNQPFESQRVPLPIIQALGAPTFRTDILLLMSPSTVSLLTTGHVINVSLPYKIHTEVVRVWLFDGQQLQYLATLEGMNSQEGGWAYTINQIYELNNPLPEQDMRDDGWLYGKLERYLFLPPAVASQLLSNLRHAIFGDEGEGVPSDHDEPQPPKLRKEPSLTSSFSVSQAVEAQLQSDILQSTTHASSDPVHIPIPIPEEDEEEEIIPSTPLAPRTITKTTTIPTATTSPSRRFRPSQATTVSQLSTPEKIPSSAIRPPPPSGSSNITFQDIPTDSSPLFAVPLGSTSQLLTKSQMLPDSLLRDDTRVPPEIWDSQDED